MYYHLTMTLHLTLMMTTAQVVKTSVANSSLSKDYLHPDDHAKQITDTPGFKPGFTMREPVTRSNMRNNTWQRVLFLKYLCLLFWNIYMCRLLFRAFTDWLTSIMVFIVFILLYLFIVFIYYLLFTLYTFLQCKTSTVCLYSVLFISLLYLFINVFCSLIPLFAVVITQLFYS